MWWFAAAGPALACTEVDVASVADVPRPGIVVLGERHGHRDDLHHAAEVVASLAEAGPVTVALEAVSEPHQDVLDRLTAGELRPRRVKRETNWDHTWGHDFAPYRRLLGVRGVSFVAAGPPLGPAPEGADVAVPDAYEAKLRDQALAHGMPESAVPDFAEAMAWRDLRIAQLAVEGWSGDGALVVVAGRGHVAEGLGITWQLAQGLAEAPVSSALLAPSDACGPEDRYLE